ncbi:MAG: hypothetical protein ACYSU0_19510 [Planctomycetota bacterium]
MLNRIRKTIQSAVGAGIPHQIPGYSRGNNQWSFSVGGIECPPDVSSMERAADLLQAALANEFGDAMSPVNRSVFPPDGDVVLSATLSEDVWQVQMCVSIFKRSSSRVFLFPGYLVVRSPGLNPGMERPLNVDP